MKKTLTILWIIIIIGTIFIAINIFKPKPITPEDTKLKIEEIEEEAEIIIEEITAEIDLEKDKTYTEYLTKGTESIKNRYFKTAIENYKSASKINPNSAIPLIKLSEAYLLNNEPEEAKKTLEKALKLQPTNLKIQILLAKSELNSRNIEKAREIIWSLDEEELEVQYYKGIISILYKQHNQAKNFFSNIINTNPESIFAKNSEKFLNAFKVFSYYPDSNIIFRDLMLAKTLTEVKEYEASIPFLFEIINKKNNYRDAWIILGYSYLNTNRPREAIDALEQARNLSPNKPETLFYLGLAYFSNNEIRSAIHYLESAKKLGFEPSEQLELRLGNLYLLQERYKEASQEYENIIRKNPNNIDIFIHIIWIYLEKLENPEYALEIANLAKEKHPQNAMTYNLLGWIYTTLKDFKKAEENLKISLEINPKLDVANLNLGLLYEQMGENELAKEYYKKAYTFGQTSPIGNIAAIRFNELTRKELENDTEKNNNDKNKIKSPTPNAIIPR